MTERSIWDAPPLAPEDQQLIDAYESVGRSVDDLPYTEEFDAVLRKLGYPETQEQRHSVFKRLLRLRKSGRLPHLGRSSAESF